VTSCPADLVVLGQYFRPEVDRHRGDQSTVSKHLKLLREAGLVSVRQEAQRRVYRLRAAPLAEIDEWLAPYRAHWRSHLDALENHLDST